MRKILALLLAILLLAPSLASAAIAFDAASSVAGNAVTSLTVSHTVTGSNTILIVGITTVNISGGDIVSGVTYNGSAMTLLAKRDLNTGNHFYETYYFYQINPSTGTNNIVASFSATALNSYLAASSYTGVKQTGFPDAQVQNSNTGGGTMTATLTTIADSAWPVVFFWADDNGIGAGAGTTARAIISSRGMIADSNAPISPPGSTSLQATVSGSTDTEGYIMASLAPAVTPVSPLGTGFMILFGDW